MTLHIRAHGARQFQARVFSGRQLIGEPSLHDSVEQAIEAYGAMPDLADPAQAPAAPVAPAAASAAGFQLWYEGATVGQVTAQQMCSDAPMLARRLSVLAAVLR